jgi:hypothetical protein
MQKPHHRKLKKETGSASPGCVDRSEEVLRALVTVLARSAAREWIDAHSSNSNSKEKPTDD